ncbi:restriction endonuclease subunit S [Cognatazoarcus halotolerans]|uniref:restriction endonuclease subunit S n=1 Tax=Cognatazoarcus halotolerans TaxID=2686016 RepID=UPI00135CE3C0|nr:restriction endonuclease subunit S [Cognatazoarcus halotolerans]MCB1899822.1 restriction endonuclease subunit S [Rhodocyclaceae bacterium]
MIERDLKPGWKVWRFEQMATNVNVRIDNPSESGMDHYVGLEHLDADSLKIRRWGTPDDVEATKLMFKKGDIIFGRRRAYQRKLGVAEFDGICSAHAMVLRPKPDVVLPEFLPFFMQSDLFMSRAVEISVGSLSPTINWKTMAVQEFSLPPLSQQSKVTELFLAIDAAVEEHRLLIASIEAAQKAMLIDGLGKGWKTKRISEIGNVITGKTPPTGNPDCWGSEIPFATPADLAFDTGHLACVERSISKIGSSYSRVAPAGATLVVCIGSTIGKVAQTIGSTAFNQQINAIVCHSVDPDYFYAVSTTIGSELSKRSGTTAVPIINKGEFEKIEIPIPPYESQVEIAGRFNEFTESKKASKVRLNDLLSLRAKAIQGFAGGE